MRNKPTPAPATESAVREELDRALVELPDRVREAVVLRYLEGHGQEEAARMAGCDKGTLSRRCTRGLTRMAALLTRRGVSVAPAVLAGILASQAAGNIAAATLTSLQGVAAGGASSAHASVLAQGTIKAMFWAKAKMCVGLVAALATVATAGAVISMIVPTA